MESSRLASLNDDLRIVDELIDRVSTLSFSSSLSLLFDKREKCEFGEEITNSAHFQRLGTFTLTDDLIGGMNPFEGIIGSSAEDSCIRRAPKNDFESLIGHISHGWIMNLRLLQCRCKRYYQSVQKSETSLSEGGDGDRWRSNDLGPLVAAVKRRDTHPGVPL